MLDLLNYEDRKTFLEDKDTEENRERKEESFLAYEVFNDRLRAYVEAYLLGQFSESTVLEMPIVSSINLAKRVVTKEASIYNNCPEREWTNLTEDQEDELEKFYEDVMIDQKLLKANQFYKLQGQAFLLPIVKQGRFELRLVLPHQFDAVPNDDFPTEADAVVLSSMDRNRVMTSDMLNQSVSDKDDYRSTLEKYIVWTKEWNYAFNGKGLITTEVLPNPLGEIPLIDISQCKDSEYFVRTGQSLSDFAIQYCGYLSDLGHVVKMQGWSVAYMKGDKDLMPKSLRVGPSIVLHLPIDPNRPVDTEFGFASPNPDLQGSIAYGENLIATFLTSRGLDATLISGKANSKTYSSGLERLLAMLDQFEASKSDYNLFEKIEKQLFEKIKLWSDATYGTDQAFLSFKIPDTCELSVKFGNPEMVQSEKEKLDTLIAKLDAGLISKVEAIQYDRNVDSEKAAEILLEIEADTLSMPQGQNVNEDKAKPKSIGS